MLCTLLSGCPGPSECVAPQVEPGAPAWETILDENALDGAVLSVWGSAPDSVFIAGGPLGNEGHSALAWHYNGCEWKDLNAGGSETFWWVGGTSDKDVWFVGEKGRIAHYDGTTITNVESGIDATIWGVYAFSPNDVWAAAGTPEGGTAKPNDIVLHFDGSSWKQETLPGEPRGVSLFKVWGPSADNFFVVGEQGTIWHREGGTWTLETGDPPITGARLFTVHGCGPNDVYAVGGQSVLHRDENGWSEVSISLGNQVNGVSCGPPGSAVLVGFGGLKQRLVDGSWIDEFDSEPFGNMHAAWADGEGAFWAVGGDFLSGPKAEKRDGLVARYGPTGVVQGK
ncbi:MAG: hypothetical protein IPK82_27645 [Polyangiaceae bacterium]|nr:hypothetical protein [Polyangiaceae bacterium]